VAAFDEWENDRLDYLFEMAGTLLPESEESPRGERSSRAVFVDVGAHWGLYSLRAWSSGLFDRIIAFEPEPHRADQFRANMVLNGASQAIEFIQAAAADRVASLELAADGLIVDSPSPGTESIRSVVPDDVIDTRAAVLVMKIDIEGFEDRAISGMRRLLTGNRGFLQVEVWEENLDSVVPLLEELEYRQVHDIGHDRYFRNF
jgi:FkbM family methyltransferase